MQYGDDEQRTEQWTGHASQQNPQRSMQGNGAVVTCTVTECSYNQQESCCASTIEVGEDHPSCDTFTTDGPQASMSSSLSQVAQCHVEDCSFNQSQDCTAPGITVTHHSNHADCLSYRSQM